MSTKIHYLDAHVDKFNKNGGGFGEQQGENFNQEMKVFEFRFKNNDLKEMIADFSWTRYLEIDLPGRKPKNYNFF